MYATGVGLVISGLKDAEEIAKRDQHKLPADKSTQPDEPTPQPPARTPFGRNWLDFIKKSLVDDGGDSNLNG